MNCPHFGKEIDCDTCLFQKQGLCDFPFGVTPFGELFEFKPIDKVNIIDWSNLDGDSPDNVGGILSDIKAKIGEVSSKDIFGEYTMGIIEGLEAGDEM